MTPAEFDALFDSFRESAFRLETRAQYLDDEEAEELAMFLAGEPLPERSARTDPWLRRVAETTAADKRWQRVHVVSHPLTDYLRFELGSQGYEGNVACGEDVRIADRDRYPELDQLTDDFWLLDGDTDRPMLILMRYDDEGRLLSADQVHSRDAIDGARRQRDFALARSAPLSDFMAQAGA